MIIQFTTIFKKDLTRLKKNLKVYHDTLDVINNIEEASSINEITELKKLKGGKDVYSIIMGTYRIGLFISSG